MDLVSMGLSQCGAAGPGGGTSETSVSRDQTLDLVICQPANIATELVTCQPGNIATELVTCDPANIATELFISEAGDYNITGTHHQVKIITLLAFIERFTRDLPLFLLQVLARLSFCSTILRIFVFDCSYPTEHQT